MFFPSTAWSLLSTADLFWDPCRYQNPWLFFLYIEKMEEGGEKEDRHEPFSPSLLSPPLMKQLLAIISVTTPIWWTENQPRAMLSTVEEAPGRQAQHLSGLIQQCWWPTQHGPSKQWLSPANQWKSFRTWQATPVVQGMQETLQKSWHYILQLFLLTRIVLLLLFYYYYFCCCWFFYPSSTLRYVF